MTTVTATTHLRVPYEGDPAEAGDLEDALQHPAGTCARCDDGSPEDRYYGLAQVNRRLGTEIERLREAIRAHREARGTPKRDDGSYAGFPADEALWACLDEEPRKTASVR